MSVDSINKPGLELVWTPVWGPDKVGVYMSVYRWPQVKKWNLFRALVKFYTTVRCPPPMYSPSQGIVTYMYVLPVEAGSRILISENHSSSRDCSLELACLILQGFKGQKPSLVSEQMCWLVDISCSEFILISSLREHWSLGSILIPIANTATLGGGGNIPKDCL